MRRLQGVQFLLAALWLAGAGNPVSAFESVAALPGDPGVAFAAGAGDISRPVANTDRYHYEDLDGTQNVLDNDSCGGECRVGEPISPWPRNGTVNWSEADEGSFTYTPDPTFTEGKDCFGYYILSGGIRSKASRVCIKVSAATGSERPDGYKPPGTNEPKPPVASFPDNAPAPEECELIELHEEFPECKVTYQPALLPREQWSRPEFAPPIHDEKAARVVLMERELLQDALARLYAQNPEGGVIEVPWDVDTAQCDKLHMSKQPLTKLSVIGTRGPNGELPRFYCRRYKENIEDDGSVTVIYSDGTIVDAGGGVFFHQGRLLDEQDRTIKTHAYIEGIHVDGYTNWFKAAVSGTLSLVNVYAHHATSNGIVSDAIKLATRYFPQGNDTQIGGSEIAMGGQGNTEHCIYYHGSSVPGVQQRLSMTGNVIHSCNWSSAIKSIAQYNDIDGNMILKTLETDPTYSRRHSLMLVDIASCSETYIRDNYLVQVRPFKVTPGGAAISSRSRKSYFGCNWPDLGWDDATGRDPVKLPDAQFWDPVYWAEVGGRKTIPWYVEGNTFVTEGYKADRQVAVEASGTLPNYTYTLGGWSCYLQPPAGWTERSMLYADNNTYVGYNKTYAHKVTYPGEKMQPGDTDKCGNVFDWPDVRDYNLITVGAGEVYK